jgi:RNA recognition motif-containing protein|uniref:RRM domain-containing protein n=1 Tax=Panagrolaimus sp. PS1159 TaxID=55785 RepID=A0AC35G6H0_9BILA
MPGYRSRRDSRSPSPRRGGGGGGRGGSRERSGSPPSVKRLHLADLDETVTRRGVEDAFGKFGKLADVWVASYPPYFGFVVYERSDDAADALKAMRHGYIGDCHIRVTVALPRGSRRSPRPYRRDDRGGGYGGGRGGGRYDDRDRRGGGDRGYGRREERDRRRSRTRSPPRKREYSNSRSRSRSPVNGNGNSRRRASPVADDVSE